MTARSFFVKALQKGIRSVMRKAAVIKEVRTRGPSPEKTAQTRRAIVSAALAEFLENGFANATMESVARRAGVAKGTPYRYFPTKEALFSGVVQQEIAGAFARLRCLEARDRRKRRGVSPARLCSQSLRISKRRDARQSRASSLSRAFTFRLSSRSIAGRWRTQCSIGLSGCWSRRARQASCGTIF